MNALSESNIAADMTLPAREIPGSGPENMQNMLQLQTHEKLNTSFKYYTEHMYKYKTILTSKSHYMQFSKKKGTLHKLI